MRDITKKEYNDFISEISRMITKARTDTSPMLSRREFADKIKVTEMAVGNWERGQRIPPVKKMFVIAAAAGKKLKISFE